jgi:hypothetical protein
LRASSICSGVRCGFPSSFAAGIAESLFIAGSFAAWRGPASGRRVIRRLPLCHLSCLERRHEVLVCQLARALVDRLEARETRGHRRIGDPLGMQLLIDVSGQPDLTHAIDISRARTEPDAVQDVEDRLVVRVGGNTRAGTARGQRRRGEDGDGGA